MSKFLTKLIICPYDDFDTTWDLVEPLIYQSDLLKALGLVEDGIITIKPFVHDLASVPRLPFIYELWGGRAHYESVPHDWAYRIDCPVPMTYSVANRLFLECMGARHKTKKVRYPMYAGVVLGGWRSWKKRMMDWKPSDKAACDPPDPTSSELIKP